MKKIGELITEILEYKPGVMYVKRYVRPKYAKTDGEGVVVGEYHIFYNTNININPNKFHKIYVNSKTSLNRDNMFMYLH